MTTTPEGPEPTPAGYDGPPPQIVVPDDARDLDLDRRALLRERAVARRRARLSRLVFTRRWHTHGISGPIVVICLSIVFVFAVLLALMVPNGGNGPHAAAALSASTLKPGLKGSLLPAETLKGAGRDATDVFSRDLRPGLLLVLPGVCTTTETARTACGGAIDNALGAARDYDYRRWMVGKTGNSQLATLAESTAESTFAIPFFDTTGGILAAFPAVTTPTAVFIDAHGLVFAVLPNITADTALTPVFDRLGGLA